MERPKDVPEDVWQSANMDVVHAPEYTARLHEDVARALLAERERCAKVAELLNGWGADNGAGGHAEYIARAIRGDA